MEKKKLDVLVTFYNQEKYVDRAMASIFSQECNFDFNVLIGDDGSTDNTILNVKKWMDIYPDRIEIFSMERENGKKYVGGFRASRNRLNLLKHVVSEYFIFLDGDDYFCDVDKFQKQINILDNPANCDCIGCSHNINALYPDGTLKPYNKMAIGEGKYDIKRYWFDLYFHTDTTIVRSSVIRNLPAKLLENNFNDNLITYSIMQLGKLYFILDVMAVYDQTGEGIWTGEKAIVNNIRNMFLYDLCIKMNKKLTFQSNIRFRSTWGNLYKLRNHIDAKSLGEIIEEAKDKHLTYSQLWLQYGELSNLNKLSLYLKYIEIFFSNIVYQLCVKFLRGGEKSVSSIKKALIYFKTVSFQNKWKESTDKKAEQKYDNDGKHTIHENKLNIEILPIYKNKNGIVTVISDDGDYDTSIILDSLAEKYKIPITVAGNVKNVAPHIEYWRNTLKKGNIELVNHSYNHLRMDENWKYSKCKDRFIHEIVHSRLFFERQLEINEPVFVCPENALCDLGYEVIEEDKLMAVRRGTRGVNSLTPKEGTDPGDWLNLKCYGIMDQPHSLETRREMRNKWLKEADGNWLIEMWHNVDKKGYQTIDSKSAEEHLKDICKYRDEMNLWCAKFSDAVKYLWEKENAVIYSWLEDGKTHVFIDLNNSLNISNLHSLTIAIPKEYISENNTDCATYKDKFAEVNIFPKKLYVFNR